MLFPVLVLALEFLVILENRGYGRAIFSLQARNLGQAIFHSLQAGWIDVHTLSVCQQTPRPFLDEIVTLLQVRLEVLLAGIEARQLGQFFEGGSEQGKGRGLITIEDRIGIL